MLNKLSVTLVLATLLILIGTGNGQAVKPGYMEIPRDQIEAIYTRFITHKIPWAKEDVRITDIHCGDKIILPKGQLTYEVISPRGCTYLGRVCLSIAFKINGRYENKVRVTGRVNVFKKVIYTIRPLRRHEVIRPQDIKLVERNITYLPDQIITDPEEVVGKRTVRSVGAGEIVTKNLVESLPLIKKGDIITILAESETLRVVAKGKARQRGYLGDQIRVLNIGSKREVYAKVIDNSTVKVEF